MEENSFRTYEFLNDLEISYNSLDEEKSIWNKKILYSRFQRYIFILFRKKSTPWLQRAFYKQFYRERSMLFLLWKRNCYLQSSKKDVDLKEILEIKLETLKSKNTRKK